MELSKPILLTDAAKQALKSMRIAYKLDEKHKVRVGMRGSGCGSSSYFLGFDIKTDKDDSYNIDGIEFLMQKGQMMHLLGYTIDFVEEASTKGFVFFAPER